MSDALVLPCPSCGRSMVERVNRQTGTSFLACTGYAERDAADQPVCAETRPIPESVRLRRLGAAELPLFDAEVGV